MPLPTPPNNTCDIYRSTNAPPAAPDVAAVPCYLKALYPQGLERGEGDPTNLKFTHSILVDTTVDIRDAYSLQQIGNTYDTIYIPDKNGTAWIVVFVEMVDLGIAAFQHKRVFLTRNLPTYPTSNL
jgi:hypothetical protein